MTTQTTAGIEGKKYHIGGRLCSDDLRADQTTSKGCEKRKADDLYGKRDRRQESTRIMARLRQH
jgi:hypothetical protein